MGTEMRRVTDREHATALRRIERAEKQIANLEKRIHALKEDGQSTLEAERLLQLMQQSRASMQRQADHFAKDKT
jgi:ribose 1,5-bisphosphokinase PhnN